MALAADLDYYKDQYKQCWAPVTMNSMTEEQIRLQISLAHAYLEVARAIFAEKDDESGQATRDYATTFSLLSVTIVYSYLALESFINYYFYRIYEHSLKVHTAIEEDSIAKIVPTYDEFFQEFGSTPLERLRPELKVKIKAICTAYEIPQVYEVQPRLWQDFCNILKPARDFLVHAVPEPSIFENNMRRLMEETSAGKYVEIVIRIIEHFYEHTGKPVPDWLYQNKLLQFQAIRLFHQQNNGA